MCMSQLGGVRAADGTVAVVELDGRLQRVPLVALGDQAASVAPGDWLLLHTGLAVRRVDATEAAELGAALHETNGGAA
jgi:hydrogenase expression/formation protein HypC